MLHYEKHMKFYEFTVPDAEGLLTCKFTSDQASSYTLCLKNLGGHCNIIFSNTDHTDTFDRCCIYINNIYFKYD